MITTAGKRSIVFCASQRTGSTLIADDLSNLCGGGPLNSELLYVELLRSEISQSWQGVWKSVLKSNRVRGFVINKVMFHYVPYISTAILGGKITKRPPIYAFSPEQFGPFFEFFRDSIWIYVQRRDIFSQAVSMYFAEMTDRWEVRPWKTEDQRRPAPHLPYDRTRLMQYVRAFALENTEWQKFFVHYGIEPVRVAYEDAVENYPAYLDEVMMKMQLTRSRVRPRRLVKLGDATNDRFARSLRRDVFDHPILRSIVTP